MDIVLVLLKALSMGIERLNTVEVHLYVALTDSVVTLFFRK